MKCVIVLKRSKVDTNIATEQTRVISDLYRTEDISVYWEATLSTEWNQIWIAQLTDHYIDRGQCRIAVQRLLSLCTKINVDLLYRDQCRTSVQRTMWNWGQCRTSVQRTMWNRGQCRTSVQRPMWNREANVEPLYRDHCRIHKYLVSVSVAF